MTTLVRSLVGRRILSSMLSKMEARSAVVFEYLMDDPRLQL